MQASLPELHDHARISSSTTTAAWLDEHARARRTPGACRDRHLLLGRNFLLAQRRETQ